MLWSPKLSLSNIHVRLTAKGLLRNIQLLSGCRKSPVVFKAGLSISSMFNPAAVWLPTDISFLNHCLTNFLVQLSNLLMKKLYLRK
uniref:Uncharacterized protein n=1 Tax=Cyprinodon variegatus TaxID=28743 RepID=A0A3Q2DAA8_CYPVA